MQISSKPGLGISYSIPPSSQHSQPAPQQASMMSMPSGSSGGDALLGAGPGLPRPASKRVGDPPPFYHSASGAGAPGNRFIDNDTTLFTNTTPSAYSSAHHGNIGMGGARGSPAVVHARGDPSMGSLGSSTRQSGTRGQVMDREGLEEALDEIYDHRILFLGRFELYGQVRAPPHPAPSDVAAGARRCVACVPEIDKLPARGPPPFAPLRASGQPWCACIITTRIRGDGSVRTGAEQLLNGCIRDDQGSDTGSCGSH